MPGPKEIFLVEPLNWQEEGRNDANRHSDEVNDGWQTVLRHTLLYDRSNRVLFSSAVRGGGVAVMVPIQSFGDWVEIDPRVSLTICG